MATYTYARVSTDRQADAGESLALQQRQTEGCALMLGAKVDETFVERGVSGSVPFAERPEGARLLAALKPGDVVIAAKLDRCFRDAEDALHVLKVLKDRGVKLHLIDLGGDVTGNGIAQLVFTILSGVAEWERDRIRERVAEVKRDQAARGRYLGGIRPFGHRVSKDGELEEDAAEQAAIRKAKAMRASGVKLRAIVAALANDGHKISLSGLHGILNS